MNVRNGETFVERAIQSVLNQSFQDLELIVFDNASEDGTLLTTHSIQDTRLRVCHSNQILTLYEARNRACSLATGRYLAFLDVDDVWRMKKLDRQLATMHRFSCEASFTNAIHRTGSVRRWIRNFSWTSSKLSQERILKRYPVPMSSLVVSRSTFEALGGFQPGYTFVGDFDFVYRLSRIADIRPCRQPLVEIWHHDMNLSREREAHTTELREWALRTNDSFSGEDLLLVNDVIATREILDNITTLQFKSFRQKIRRIISWKRRLYLNVKFLANSFVKRWPKANQ